jgi:hypothetical protein
MKNKKLFSFDEEKDAQLIILNGFPNGNIVYTDMYIVAKYFREHFKYGEIRLEKKLVEFCKAQDKNFNPIVEASALKKWVKSAMKYELRKISSINISPKEITFLKTIETPRDRKLLFITLILSKALKKRSTKRDKSKLKTSDNYYIRYSNFPDIIKLSKIQGLSEMGLASIYFEYKEYFTIYNPDKELLKLEYVDKNPENEIVLDDLDKLSDYYERLFGKKTSLSKSTTIFCSICGKAFKKNSNRQKACSDCSSILNKKRVEKFRNKK